MSRSARDSILWRSGSTSRATSCFGTRAGTEAAICAELARSIAASAVVRGCAFTLRWRLVVYDCVTMKQAWLAVGAPVIDAATTPCRDAQVTEAEQSELTR